jgi:tripartite-type tricarboxylate transporter receptor subunit TctC
MPFAPGGPTEFIIRLVADRLTATLGQAFVIENRPGGAGGTVGAKSVAVAEPDGYTLLFSSPGPLVTAAAVYKSLDYDPIRSFAPIAMLIYAPQMLVVHPSVPANSVKELIALAKAKPGQLSFASGGAGAGAHLSGELFRSLAEVDVTHVPYKGNAPALIDLIGGQVTMMFDTVNTAMPHVKSGKLKLLATTTPQRSSFAPDTPTMIEQGLPGFEVSAWYAVLAPAKTPRDVIAKLNAEINKALADPEMKTRFAAQGVEFVGGTPEAAETFMRNEGARWGKVIKATGMKAD